MLLLGVLVALSLLAMTGLYGARKGTFRKRGLAAGIVLLAVVAGLVLSHTVR